MNEVKTVQARAATPEEKSWLEHLRQTEQQIPNRIEDAAKFLATMISVSFSFFLGAGNTQTIDAFDMQAQAAVVFWLLSLVCAFMVLFPFRYKVVRDSAQDIQKQHRKIVLVKRTLLIVSLLFFAAALVLLARLFFF